MPYHFEISESVPESLEKMLFTGLNQNAKLCKGMNPIRTFSVIIKDDAQNPVGGVSGMTYYGCLYVDMLWLDPSIRNLRLGSKLMQEAEKIARTRSCTFATVNTMDWEALPFYQKLGYEIEFVRKGYEKDSSKYMLKKSLN